MTVYPLTATTALLIASCLQSVAYAGKTLLNRPTGIVTHHCYEPYLNRSDGTPYEDGFQNLAQPPLVLSGSFSVVFFGAVNAGKSRLIEALTGEPRETYSRPSHVVPGQGHTKETEIYQVVDNQTQNNLYLIDTPGLGIRSLPALRKVIGGVQDVQDFLEEHRDAPLKRLYYVIDISDRFSRQKLNVVKNLELLKNAFGVELSSQIQFILNKSDSCVHLGKIRFDELLGDVTSFYKEVFPDRHPSDFLTVSAEKGCGQLLEDLHGACHSPSLDLLRAGYQWSNDLVQTLLQIQDHDHDFNRIDVQHDQCKSKLSQQREILNEIVSSLATTRALIKPEKDDPRSDIESVWDHDQASSVFKDVNALMIPISTSTSSSSSNGNLHLLFRTMREARQNHNFAATFLSRFDNLEGKCTDSFDRTLKTWRQMELDWNNCGNRPDPSTDHHLEEQKKAAETEIDNLSKRLLVLKQIQDLKQYLKAVF